MTTTTATRRIGSNRGNRRIWLEGSILADAGWSKGDRYDRTTDGTTILITPNPAGRYKVAGTADRPIIDMAGAWVTRLAGDAATARVLAYENGIMVTI